MIEKVIPYTKNFSRETLLGRLEATKISLKQFGDLPRVETTFSAPSVWTTLSRSAKTNGDYSSNNRSRFDKDKKIEEGISLLVRRELDHKKIFKCWSCDEFGHYDSKFPKRVKKYKNNFKSRKPRECLYANDDDELDERVLSESDDELGFVAIKEESPKK